MTPPLTLEVASRLIEDGTAAKLADRQQRVAKLRQQRSQRVLGADAILNLSDGFHLWLPLPESWRADIFRAECASLNVQVSEGRSFAFNGPEAIRLCVSHEANEERLQLGLETVAGVLRQKPNGFPMVIGFIANAVSCCSSIMWHRLKWVHPAPSSRSEQTACLVHTPFAVSNSSITDADFRDIRCGCANYRFGQA